MTNNTAQLSLLDIGAPCPHAPRPFERTPEARRAAEERTRRQLTAEKVAHDLATFGAESLDLAA